MRDDVDDGFVVLISYVEAIAKFSFGCCFVFFSVFGVIFDWYECICFGVLNVGINVVMNIGKFVVVVFDYRVVRDFIRIGRRNRGRYLWVVYGFIEFGLFVVYVMNCECYFWFG